MKSLATTTLILALAVTACAQWNGFHGGPQRTGHSTAIVSSTLTQKWAVNVGGPVVTSPVIGKDGTIYLGPVLQDKEVKPSYDIIALNPDGSIKYRYETPFKDMDRPTVSTPVVDDAGNLYVGSPSGYFYALDASGGLRWRRKFSGPVNQSPVIGPNGDIYVGAQGELVAFKPDSTIAWRVPNGMALPGGPTVAKDGTIYIPYAIDDQNPSYLRAYNPDGTLKWEQYADWYYFPLSTPVVGPDGTIFIVGQRIHAYNPDGTEKWTCEPQYGINNYAAPAVDPQGNLYYSSYIESWKISPAGAILWRYTLTPDGHQNGKTYGSIAVDGAGKVFLPLGDGKRHAIPYEKQMLVFNNSGSVIASKAFPEIPSGAPAIAPSGTLYVGCLDGKLYAFGS